MKKKTKNAAPVLRLVALLLLLCCILGSCGAKSTDPTEDTVAFTDALGRRVSLPKHPERVAALLGSFAEVWTLAGGTVCAAPEDAWETSSVVTADTVNIGGAHSPSLERLLSAEPDLVLASASTASNVELLDTLEEMKLSVVYFDVTHFEDYLAMLRCCTELTDRPDLYEQNGASLKARIDSVTERCAANLTDSNRRILLLRLSSTSLKAKGSEGTVLGEMLSDVGCVNLADQNASLLENFSVEAVMREEPYRIFVVGMGLENEAARAALNTLLKENPAWGTLEAVRAGRIHVMDKTLFNQKPNARWAEAYEILYEILTST